jgi:hypothetical protein
MEGHVDNCKMPLDTCRWPDGWRWNKNHRGCPSTTYDD